MHPRTLIALSAASALSAAAAAQVVYDAALGTLPSDQCFSDNTGGFLTRTVQDGVLHQSTLGPPVAGAFDDRFLAWERSDVHLDLASGFEMELLVRPLLIQRTDRTPVLRTGLAMAALDDVGLYAAAWFESGRVTLVNDRDAPSRGHAASAPFPQDGLFHTFRLRADPAGLHLDIDGAEALSLPFGAPDGAGPFVFFGDPTEFAGANGEYDIRSFRFTGAGPGPITRLTGPDPATVCASGSALFTVVPEGTARFTHQWQVEDAPDVWRDLADGPLVLAGVHVADVEGALTDSLRCTLVAAPAPSPAVRVRDRVTNPCGSVFSEPAALTVCRADVNCDAFLDFFDYDDFVSAFESGAAAGDFNADGFIDFFDYDEFVAAFETGC